MNDELRRITRQTDASISTIHHTLRAPRRRLIILLLSNRVHSTEDSGTESQSADSSLSARELAKCIVAIEQDTTVAEATGDEYHSVYTAITQVHLDRLDDVGAIRYHPQRKIVEPGPNLVAFASITSVTTPLTRFLFNRDLASLYSRGGEHKGEPQSPIEEDTSPR